MLIEVELLDESFLQIEFQDFNINSFLKAILIFLRIPDFSGIGVNYIDNDGHYMWLPFEGTFYEIDFYKKLPIIALFLRIRFFASSILRIHPIESVFQYFLYGVASLDKLELPKFVLDQLNRIKSFVFTGSRTHIVPLMENDVQTNLDILRGFSESDLTCRGEALLRFLEFLYRLPCFNGHFYEFENIEEGKIFLIVILPMGLRRYQVLKRTHDISKDALIPWKKMRSVFVEDNFLSVEHVQKPSSDGRNKVVTTSWLCPSHWHATNLCAEVIHQRLWHLSELKKDEGPNKLDDSPIEARLCRAFELSRWLAKHYPSKPSRWTPTRLVGGSSGGDGSEGVDEKTPRTRRRDARCAAHRSQKGSRLTQEEAFKASGDSARWSASRIASQFLHITGVEAKQISEMIESWRLTDRHRLLDTSLSMSELNALGGVNSTRKLSVPPPPPLPLLPPPRPPETYQRHLCSRAQTEEPRRETMVSSKGSSVRFLGFLKRPEGKKKQQQQQGEGRVQEELKSEGPRPQRVATTATAAEEERELLEVAAELKWLILESSRRLTDLCREEERLTGRLPVECIPECKAGHSAGPLTVITRSITCHSPSSFPTDSSITPRSAVSATAVPREFSATTVSMNESWSLKRLPPTAIERFDSTGRTTISSTLSTSSTSRQREQNGGPHCQIPSHLIDQKSKVVSRVYPPLRVSASRGVYEMGNWLSESQTNYRQVQSRRETIVLPEVCRQSSEPPIVFKMAQGHAPDAMADYSREVFYSPHQRQHNYRYYHQQRQYHHHYHPQEEQQNHQRLRRFPAYETGDEEAVERMQVELRAGHAPQWSVSVSQREKTPGPPQAAFYISPRNPPDYSLGARQSCPPCTHSRSAYPEHEGEHTRTRNYVTAKRTAVYRAGDRPAVY